MILYFKKTIHIFTIVILKILLNALLHAIIRVIEIYLLKLELGI